LAALHHADLDIDVTTEARFHPIEVLRCMRPKLGVVALGAPAIAVLAFEALLNATSMFNHGNVRMPARIVRVLRWAVVTPDMHRVHHSSDALEANSNFGCNLPCWEHLFGTHRDQPAVGHEAMTIGFEQFRERAVRPGRRRRVHRRARPLRELPLRMREIAHYKGDMTILVRKAQVRSAKAAALLRESGFRHLSVVRRGMVEWVRQQGSSQAK
jgi:rhodanese-related sulfurtransferase